MTAEDCARRIRAYGIEDEGCFAFIAGEKYIIYEALVHDNFYKQQKKFKFGQIIWWKYLYNVLKISNFEEIFQDSLWLLTSRHHRAKIANYSTSCTPISEKQSICRASSLWQR
jgi:hypothetical protein